MSLPLNHEVISEKFLSTLSKELVFMWISMIQLTINNIDIKWKESFVYGDDERDFCLLNLTSNPFVINPDVEFKDICIKK